MPTAAKLIAALAFALLSWQLSQMYRPLLPEGTPSGMLAPINAVIGALMGWLLSGARAGEGYPASLAHALTTMLAILFWALLLWSAVEMVDKSMNLRYGGPTPALIDMFSMMMDFGKMIAQPDILAVMAIGTAAAGLLVEFTSTRWR